MASKPVMLRHEQVEHDGVGRGASAHRRTAVVAVGGLADHLVAVVRAAGGGAASRTSGSSSTTSDLVIAAGSCTSTSTPPPSRLRMSTAPPSCSTSAGPRRARGRGERRSSRPLAPEERLDDEGQLGGGHARAPVGDDDTARRPSAIGDLDRRRAVLAALSSSGASGAPAPGRVHERRGVALDVESPAPSSVAQARPRLAAVDAIGVGPARRRAGRSRRRWRRAGRRAAPRPGGPTRRIASWSSAAAAGSSAWCRGARPGPAAW